MDPPGDPRDQFVELYVFCEDTILRLERRIRLRVVELRLSTSCHWRKPHKGGPRIMSRTTLAALLLLATTARADETVVVIVADTLRADYCTVEHMPFVSGALAPRATVYTRAWSTSNWTLPAHGSLFTGLWPHEHGAVTETTRLRDDVPTLAEWYRDRGYRTEAIVANWAFVSKHYGLDRGFDSFQHTATWTQESAVPMACATLEQPGDLFLFINLMDCHEPYGLADEAAYLTANWTHPVPPETACTVRDAYTNGATRVDDAVRSMVLSLHMSGRWPTTRLVFASDHGEYLGEYGCWAHRKGLMPEVVRVPLIDYGGPVAVHSDTISLATVPYLLTGAFHDHGPLCVAQGNELELVRTARRGDLLAWWRDGALSGDAILYPVLDVQDYAAPEATPDTEALQSLGYL